MSPYATYLKVGTTAAVLEMLNRFDTARLPQLDEPVETMREISRDPRWYWDCDLKDGSPTTALEIQRQYLALVREVLPEPTDGFQLEDWEKILDDLERGPETTVDRLDWTAKLDIVSKFREAENLGEEDPWLISLDLSYHLLDESEGLYYGLRDQGQFQQPPGVTTTPKKSFPPPMDTRAHVRGLCVQRFGQHVVAAQWDHVRLKDETATLELDLRGLFAPQAIAEAVALIEKAQTVADLSPLPFAKPFKSV
jgi:proteasome accessory factor A